MFEPFLSTSVNELHILSMAECVILFENLKHKGR